MRSSAKNRSVLFAVLMLSCRVAAAAELTAAVVDADTGQPLPARVYVSREDGQWFFVESASADGSALPYREQWVPLPNSVERHTTVSAHPFRVELEPGQYTIEVERGKAYIPARQRITIGDQPRRIAIRLKRWIDMAKRGWYSGETHVHRRIEELPNVMLAEDLNVAFPVTFWTINAFESPGLDPSPLRRQGPSPLGPRTDHGYKPITIDETHVMFPRNTEYEVFSVNGQRHVLGAIFILNHKTVFDGGVPPVAKIARRAHREGALLDLDKHSWPWSMMLVAVADVDLFELANNSVWRTQFGFRQSSEAPGEYMQVEADANGMTEWGWLNYGFENYYTLLNCGFRLRPTAGTASGVHPVPLGYSRVYVHIGPTFDAQAWLNGLRAGRSFVTTGPVLFAKLNGLHAGHRFVLKEASDFELNIESVSEQPVDRIEVIVNGRITQTIRPNLAAPDGSAYVTAQTVRVPVTRSSWIAVRSFQVGKDGRVRFAHTAPWHVGVAGEPVRPRRVEVEYLIGRLRRELQRNQAVLPPAALSEFQQALRIYEGLREHAIPNGN